MSVRTPFVISRTPTRKCGQLWLEREGLSGAWVGHLPSAFYRDPSPGNDDLFGAVCAARGSVASRAVHPPRLAELGAVARGRWSIGGPCRARLPAAVVAWGPMIRTCARYAPRAARAGVALVLTARFEDCVSATGWIRRANLTEAPFAASRGGNTATRIPRSATAGRGTVEETHWGLTPEERELVFWDISWIWGPPEDVAGDAAPDHGTSSRFVYGTSVAPASRADSARELALLPDEWR
jgi:hypothetical protein